jgi:tetratricopeptide (TPR) repeat protein
MLSSTPQETFVSSKQWLELLDGFGVCYLFSDDLSGMHWLKGRFQEDFAHGERLSHLQGIAQFNIDEGQTLTEFLEKNTAPVLVWIVGPKPEAQLQALMTQLNLLRNRMIASRCVFFLHMPAGSQMFVSAHAPDLWSVRSLVFNAQSQKKWGSLQWEGITNRLSSTSNEPNKAHVGSSPAIERWTAAFKKWQVQNDKQIILPLDLGMTGFMQAQEMQQFALAKTIALQVIEVAQRQSQALGRANALKSLGDLDLRLGQVDSARNHYQQAITLYEKEQDDLGRANALQSLGDLDLRLGQVDSARNHYQQAITLYEKEQHDLGRANALKSLGDLDLRLGQVDSARSLYQQAITLYEKEQHDLGRANALQSLGDLDLRLGQVDSARNLYQQAITLYEKEQHDLGRANALQSLGDLDLRLGQVDSARSHYQQAITLYEKEQDVLGLAYTWCEIASLNWAGGEDFRLAADHALMYAKKTGSQILLNQISTSLAAVANSIKM